MKACPICGSTFSGDEMFCPHDGARLIVRDQPAQLVGEQLHHLVDLKRLLFKDAFGERYIGEMTSSHVEVKVTVFNQAFSPPESRLEALVSTKMLLDSPLPPQIATTYAWSLDDDPSYLIESHPKGPSLRLLLDERGHIDWRTALKIICSLARNLDWMDGNGVVHRALQPENIYVTDIQRGYTHLSEWAIGVLAYQGNPLEAVSQGNLVVAPNYTAPELVDGKGSADRRSTIYTLGILIYEMLTGKSPFSAPGSEETLKRIKRERPVKLSMAYPEGDLPPGLDDLFEVMTSKQPDKRFQSLQAVTNAMSTLLDDGTSANDFPEPVRAKEETDIHKKNGKTSSTKDDVEDTTSKKTMLFISSDELQRQISEVSEVGAPAAEAPAESKKQKKAPVADQPTPEKEAEKEPEAEPSSSSITDEAKDETEGGGEIDEVSKATIQMDRSVLEEDQKASEAKKATKEADDKPEAATKDDAESDTDSESDDDDKSTTRKKKRKKKRKRTDLMHEAANVAKALDEQNKADAEKAKAADAKETKDDDSSNGVQVDDPSPTGSFTKLEETKGGTTKIIIDEEFARDAEGADTPSIVVDASLTEEAEGKKGTAKSKGVSGSSATQTSEKESHTSKKSDAKDDPKEKEDSSAKKSAKASDSKKAKEDDAKDKDEASKKEDAKKDSKSETKDDDKKATSKSTTTSKSSKADDKGKASDKSADKGKTKKSSKRTSKKSRKPDRSAQEETARLPAAKTETKPGKDDSKDKDTSSKASSSASASADAASDNMEFLPQLTNDANLDEQWFSTDTEAAWDREVLMEHTARTEQKVNKALIIAIAIFVITVVSFFIYIMFIHKPDENDEEASLDRPVIEMQTKMAAHLPVEDARDSERA